ncbi:hypothetical protein BP6252_01827 [Coleophoma cylindrospora]|uniref:AAA+ ATPase domain-containing protein n=1 Tax=Coleophoma cylindrospora TaxID=1849047 RepID=A0A3D8SD23_9HELO|nr:hypothetical protein BP6252_01827 [Coleophoma cylindrospora]
MVEDPWSSMDNVAKAESRTETDDLEHQRGLPEMGHIKFIPEVRKCNFVNFKNQFNVAKEGIYAVDVLESDASLKQEIAEELKLRQFLPMQTTNNKGRLPESTSTRNVRLGQSSTKVITRVRIQSPSLLLVLSRIMEEEWESRPRTFLRPFRPLISYHAQICQVLSDLEIKLGQHGDTPETAHTPASLRKTGDQEDDDEARSSDGGTAVLAELRAYVEFMSREIMPIYYRFETLDETSDARVRFEDLWCLFRVGETIIRPCGVGADKDIDNLILGNRYWRVYALRPAWPKYRVAAPDQRRYVSDDDEMASFRVQCYYIDYTGDEFCAVSATFEIQPYEGERPVKSLKVFPQRFLPNHEAKLKASIEVGKLFLRNIETRHASYNWWTLTLDPLGEPTTDSEGNILKRPEYVDSEVIVDFVEAFQACPSWKPIPSVLKPMEQNKSTTIDDCYICWWFDSNRTKLLAETSEILVLEAGVAIWERNKNLLEDKFLTSVRDNDRNSTLTTAKYLLDHDLSLLPLRQFAYVLRDRKFAQVAAPRLTPVRESNDAFDCLKIHDSHKDMIQSLVEDHFIRKSTDKKDGVDRLSLDWIKGKGKGLFILLHGVPGVGKTATAEAVAQASGRPLFTITCGDLGLTPMEVESALQRIFRLANTWSCVLLLDEVDTFFSQRSKGDTNLTKNALVSVFLRVLEYYDGLLFLTTNRPGALDEAFRSRIHLTLYYPPLNYQQTMDIWKLNIDRLRQVEKDRSEAVSHEPLQINEKGILRFAKEKFHQDHNRNRWNGRQIRNAFQIASSLANFDARKDGIQPRLSVEHFKMIHTVTDDFDKYIKEAKGKSDGELAFDRGDRADHWDIDEGKHGNSSPYEHTSAIRGQRFAGGVGLGQWNTQSQRGPFGSRINSQSLQPPSPPPFEPRPTLVRPPSITFNHGSQASLRDWKRSPRRESKEHGSEPVYNDPSDEYISSDRNNEDDMSSGRSEGPKRGREWCDPETRSWRKRMRTTENNEEDDPISSYP